MERKVDYFWESEYAFKKFLKKVFDDKFKIKYSLSGNGIYNLVFLNDKIYEIKYTKTRAMGLMDNHKTDEDKAFIIDNIVNNLKTQNYAVFGGKYITFPVGEWIAKVEIIKKLKMPN